MITVPTEFRECGLPEWVAKRPLWTSFDTKLSIKMSGESSRRFKLVYNNRSDKNSRLSFSQMTCKKIVEGLGPNEKRVKLIAYEKHGWWELLYFYNIHFITRFTWFNDSLLSTFVNFCQFLSILVHKALCKKNATWCDTFLFGDGDKICQLGLINNILLSIMHVLDFVSISKVLRNWA